MKRVSQCFVLALMLTLCHCESLSMQVRRIESMGSCILRIQALPEFSPELQFSSHDNSSNPQNRWILATFDTSALEVVSNTDRCSQDLSNSPLLYGEFTLEIRNEIGSLVYRESWTSDTFRDSAEFSVSENALVASLSFQSSAPSQGRLSNFTSGATPFYILETSFVHEDSLPLWGARRCGYDLVSANATAIWKPRTGGNGSVDVSIDRIERDYSQGNLLTPQCSKAIEEVGLNYRYRIRGADSGLKLTRTHHFDEIPWAPDMQAVIVISSRPEDPYINEPQTLSLIIPVVRSSE